MILDRLTGLVWPRDANLGEYPMTWPEALDFVTRMNREHALGFSDWRLPNRRELRSLVSYQAKHPALPQGHPFVNIVLGWHWTSTSAAINPAYAWYVHMEGARMFYGRKDQYYLTWPVRAGDSACLFRTGQSRCHDQHGRETDCANSMQDGAIRFGTAWPKPRFSVREETVRGELTGLYWLPRADLTERPVTWSQALEAVERLREQRFGGRDDWRLPNINELESLVDCSTHNPALPTDHPFTHAGEGYWSSTTSFFATDWAWVLYLRKGALGVGFKTNPDFLVWPVAGTPQSSEEASKSPKMNG
ncbi:Lcl C-terminal domain-containing protein [Desulfonatronum thiodismutans]|uniref:Lcl C-terminal domain-containing protein n=1 Tax=Desulfonatronum thiodismutans TaxID=159290 RepID=UPI000AD2DC8F